MELEGHNWLREIPEEGLDGGGDGLGLPFQVVVETYLQEQSTLKWHSNQQQTISHLVCLSPVQPHGEQFRDLGRHSHNSVQTLVFKT